MFFLLNSLSFPLWSKCKGEMKNELNLGCAFSRPLCTTELMPASSTLTAHGAGQDLDRQYFRSACLENHTEQVMGEET